MCKSEVQPFKMVKSLSYIEGSYFDLEKTCKIQKTKKNICNKLTLTILYDSPWMLCLFA